MTREKDVKRTPATTDNAIDDSVCVSRSLSHLPQADDKGICDPGMVFMHVSGESIDFV